MPSVFKVTDGKYKGQGISYKNDFIWLGNSKVKYTDIAEIDLIDSQAVKKSDSAVFGAIGFLVGGPVGAAAGAGLGGLSRPCTFLMTLANGEVIAATGWRMHFNKMLARYKISNAIQDHDH